MINTTLRIHEATSAAAAFPAVALAGSGQFGSLAGVTFLAFLMLVLEEDLRRFQIPNRITLGLRMCRGSP